MTTSLALARHVTDRLGYGPRPGDLDRVASLGVDRWIEEQLNPHTIALPAAFAAQVANITTPRLSPLQVFAEYGPPSARPLIAGKPTPDEIRARNQRMQFVAQEAVQLRLLRGIASPCQLEECLTDFWFNHFNVFVDKGLDHLWLGSYVEDAVRPHVLGRFRDLLGATAKHPAMLFYLDNWLNTAPGSPGAKGPFSGINENYAREVMELHTLGVNGGYTQADVIALAHILTGWTIGPLRRPPVPRPPLPFAGFRPARAAAPRMMPPMPPGRGTFVFDPDRHDFSNKVFLRQTIHGDGIEEGERALDMLAKSPATARHISFQLAQYFLADDPNKDVVDAMARTFLSTDGNIRAVLRTLFRSAAFRSPQSFGAKYKTPYRFVVSAVRAGDVPVKNFRPLQGFMARLGERPYGCLTPNGYSNTRDAWLNPEGMMDRVSFAVALALGRLPLEAAPDSGVPGMMAAPRMGGMAAAAPAQPAAHSPALDATALATTLGNQFSPATRAAIDAAPPQLKAAVVLGSPEFMRC